MIILGLSPISHESAVALVVDGKVVAAASEERFTRIKNDGGFPHQALDYVLGAAGIQVKDIDVVAYAALSVGEERLRDVANFGKNLWYNITTPDHVSYKFRHLLNYTRGLVIHREWSPWSPAQSEIRRSLKKYGLLDKLVYVDHHLSHIASAYYSSGVDRCLAVSLDGYGSGQAGSFYLGENNKLRCLSAIPYPHSLGTFYRRVTQALGFKPNRHEGKIVGLAAYGDSNVLYEEVRARVDLNGDDFFRLKSVQDPYFEKHFTEKYKREDVAAAYQRVLEETAVHYVQKWVQRTGVDTVVCAGGVFANVKLNQRIAEIPEVKSIFIFPAMGDGGVGLGAALAYYSEKYELKPQRLRHVYLGPDFSEQRMEKALQEKGLAYRRVPDIEKYIAELLTQDKVVARFNGAMEFGPRALGNRSILYPAKDPTVNDWLNKRLRRSEFMPFAPITMPETAASLFENLENCAHAAEFMTITMNCTPLMKKQSPAAVHVDGTARPQVVHADVNPSVYKILQHYHQLSGIPTLVNTSFNMHEEPIVCTPEDAARAYVDSGLDVLAMGPFICENTDGRNNHS